MVGSIAPPISLIYIFTLLYIPVLESIDPSVLFPAIYIRQLRALTVTFLMPSSFSLDD